jgi:hypothetical protein
MLDSIPESTLLCVYIYCKSSFLSRDANYSQWQFSSVVTITGKAIISKVARDSIIVTLAKAVPRI